MSVLERILLIEDEPDIQAIARLALEVVGGLAVACCDSGREAVAAVREFRPHLILLDVMMPDMDGPATLSALQADSHAAHVPVIFLTAKARPEEVSRYRDLGAIGVVAKPFNPMQLSLQIREIWAAYPSPLS